MLVEKIKHIINQFENQGLNWDFNYGKEHWQNLKDFKLDAALPFQNRQKHLLLLWKDRTATLNNYGTEEGSVFDGEMVLLVRSKISEKDYNYKYETHIKNLESETKRLMNQLSTCDGWILKTWKEIEVENEFDTNLDGLKIRFTIEFHE
jgi:hypothetical protein